MDSTARSSTSSSTTSRRTPVRTCVGCRRRDEQSALLRVVAVHGPAGTDRWTVVPDQRRRAHGRGAWVHPDPACVRIAIARRAFHRALRLTQAGTVDTTPVQERYAQQT